MPIENRYEHAVPSVIYIPNNTAPNRTAASESGRISRNALSSMRASGRSSVAHRPLTHGRDIEMKKLRLQVIELKSKNHLLQRENAQLKESLLSSEKKQTVQRAEVGAVARDLEKLILEMKK